MTLLRNAPKWSYLIWLWRLYLVTSKVQYFLTRDGLVEGWLGFCGKMIRPEVRPGSPDGREMVWNFSSVSFCVAPDFTSWSGTLKRSKFGWQTRSVGFSVLLPLLRGLHWPVHFKNGNTWSRCSCYVTAPCCCISLLAWQLILIK